MNFDFFTLLAWIMVVCSGLMAGVYLTFSMVVMRSLAALEVAQGMAAMKSINREILKTAFMPLFFGSTIIAILMMVIAIWQWGASGAISMLSAGLIYTIGMFVITAAFNVPLNNRLEETDEQNQTAKQTWDHYLVYWTRWNTLRTIACVTTMLITMNLL